MFRIVRFVVQHTAPVVVVGGDTFPERDRHIGCLGECGTELAGDFAVALDVDLAVFHAAAFGGDPEHILRVRFVADDHIRKRHDLFHALARQFFGRNAAPLPQFLAEVQVAGDPDPHFRGFLHDRQSGEIGIFAQSRRDTGHMKVEHAFQHGIKIIFFRTEHGNGAVFPVIDHIGTALGGALLCKIDPHSAALGVTDLFHIRAESALLGGKGSGKHVIRQSGQIAGLPAHHGNGGANVGFAAAERGFQFARKHLAETQFSRRGKTDHHFTETGNDLFGHNQFSCLKIYLLTCSAITYMQKGECQEKKQVFQRRIARQSCRSASSVTFKLGVTFSTIETGQPESSITCASSVQIVPSEKIFRIAG